MNENSIQGNSQEWLNSKEAAVYLNISTSSINKLYLKFADLLKDELKSVSARSRTGKIKLITKQGLVILANMKDSNRSKSRSALNALQGKKQIAEIAIASVSTLPQADLMLSSLQQMIAIRQQQLDQEARLINVEQKIQTMELKQSIATEQLLLLPEPKVEARKMSDRALIRQAVNTYALVNNIKHNDVWNTLYQQIYYRLGVNAQTQAKNKGCIALDILEQENLMTEVYAIACDIFKNNK